MPACRTLLRCLRMPASQIWRRPLCCRSSTWRTPRYGGADASSATGAANRGSSARARHTYVYAGHRRDADRTFVRCFGRVRVTSAAIDSAEPTAVCGVGDAAVLQPPLASLSRWRQPPVGVAGSGVAAGRRRASHGATGEVASLRPQHRAARLGTLRLAPDERVRRLPLLALPSHWATVCRTRAEGVHPRRAVTVAGCGCCSIRLRRAPRHRRAWPPGSFG